MSNRMIFNYRIGFSQQKEKRGKHWVCPLWRRIARYDHWLRTLAEPGILHLAIISAYQRVVCLARTTDNQVVKYTEDVRSVSDDGTTACEQRSLAVFRDQRSGTPLTADEWNRHAMDSSTQAYFIAQTWSELSQKQCNIISNEGISVDDKQDFRASHWTSPHDPDLSGKRQKPVKNGDGCDKIEWLWSRLVLTGHEVHTKGSDKDVVHSSAKWQISDNVVSILQYSSWKSWNSQDL